MKRLPKCARLIKKSINHQDTEDTKFSTSSIRIAVLMFLGVLRVLVVSFMKVKEILDIIQNDGWYLVRTIGAN